MNELNKNLVLERYAFGREENLVNLYIEHGPKHLKKELAVNVEEWIVVFDYLVFEKNLLYKTVIQNVDFFMNEYVRHGTLRVREILDVEDERYDGMFSMVFDLLVVAHEGAVAHVMQHRDKYLPAFRKRGADFVRKVLGISAEKYNNTWREILDFLLNASCDDIFEESTFDHGLEAFSKIFSVSRDHRKPIKYKLIP